MTIVVSAGKGLIDCTGKTNASQSAYRLIIHKFEIE